MTLTKNSRLAVALWLPTAIAITIVCALVYWTMQQNYRLNGNDPQVQIAQDSVRDLNQVPDLAAIAQAFGQVQIKDTLSTFLVVYDDNKKPVAGNGYLGDKLPELSDAHFAQTQNGADHRFTWQPEKGQKFAAVLRRFEGQQKGYILAARSLREVEARNMMLLLASVIGWALSLIATYALYLSLAKHLNKSYSSHDHTHEHHHS